jgi:hypothetical protein
MRSPDGNGSSTGEGRKGALLLLHGRRPAEADGTPERASTLPSSNALRPDSGLNLGWYRPAPPEERPADDGDRNSHGAPRQADEPQSRVLAAATRVDLRAKSAPSDPNDSPLGARRPRRTPPDSLQQTRRRGAGLALVGLAALARVGRSAAVLLSPVARGVRKRQLAVGIAAVLLFAIAAVTVLEQPANPHRNPAQPGSALSASQFRGVFLSEVTRALAALSRSGFNASIGTAGEARSGSPAHRPSRTARAGASRSNHAMHARASASSGRSTPVSHVGANPQSVSQASTSASDSGTTAAAESPADTTPAQQARVQQTPVQQTSTQQAVHYQPPAQPAGPTGLCSQVGGNCNPKCS